MTWGIWHICVRHAAALLLSALLAAWIASAGVAESAACGPQRLEPTLAPLDRAANQTVGLLLAVRCGDRYHTSYLVVHDTEIRLQPLRPPVVSPQADGFWTMEPVLMRLPEGCEGATCRHRGTYLFASRLGHDDRGRRQAALERIRRDVAEMLDMAGPNDPVSQWRDHLLAIGEDVVCMRSIGTSPTGGPHPAYFDRDGCVRLTPGRLTLRDRLGIEPFFSGPVVERTREQLRARYRTGSFRTDQPEGADSAIGPLEAGNLRLLLDYRDGVLTALAIAEASAPYALSRTYKVEVAAEIGPAPETLTPFNPQPPDSEAVAGLVPQLRHLFIGPAPGTAVAVSDDSLAVLSTPVTQILAVMPFRADDVIVAEWAVGDAALDWERTLTGATR